MKKILGVSILTLTLTLALTGCGREQKWEPWGKIERAMGRYLWFEGSEEPVSLVGIYVPKPGDVNFSEASYGYFMSRIAGKELEGRVRLKKHKIGYPRYNLVEVRVDGINLNRDLLENGHVFFTEDHWIKKDKAEYQKLQEKAQLEMRGLWANPDKMKSLFRRDKNGRMIHFSNCEHVRDLPAEEAIEFYAPIPQTPFLAIRPAFFCDTCRPQFEEYYPWFKKDKEGFGLTKKARDVQRKVRLES